MEDGRGGRPRRLGPGRAPERPSLLAIELVQLVAAPVALPVELGQQKPSLIKELLEPSRE